MRICEELLEERAYYQYGVISAKELGTIDEIEAFISQMQRLACVNAKASYMFSAAQNGAENELDKLIQKGEL